MPYFVGINVLPTECFTMNGTIVRASLSGCEASSDLIKLKGNDPKVFKDDNETDLAQAMVGSALAWLRLS